MAAASGDIVAELTALFSHYDPAFNVNGMDEAATRQMLAQKQRLVKDWMEDLNGQPLWAVREACRLWRTGKDGNYKPKVNQILKLTRELTDPVRRPLMNAELAQKAQSTKMSQEEWFESERLRMWGPMDGEK